MKRKKKRNEKKRTKINSLPDIRNKNVGFANENIENMIKHEKKLNSKSEGLVRRLINVHVLPFIWRRQMGIQSTKRKTKLNLFWLFSYKLLLLINFRLLDSCLFHSSIRGFRMCVQHHNFCCNQTSEWIHKSKVCWEVYHLRRFVD